MPTRSVPTARRRRWFALAAAVALCVAWAPTHAGAQTTEATLKLGEAVDTNPLRLAGGSDAAAVARGVVALEHRHPVGGAGELGVEGRAISELVHGAADERTTGATAVARLRGRVARRAVLGLSSGFRGRFEPTRDADVVSSQSRAYRSLHAAAESMVRIDAWEPSASLGVRHFAYSLDRDLTWTGPVAALGLGYTPSDVVRLQAFYDYSARAYLGDRVRVGTNGGIYVDDGTRRRDDAHQVGVSLRLTPGRWVIGVRYAYERNRSNSSGSTYGRHVISPSVTGVLVGDLLVRASARVMRVAYDVRAPRDPSVRVDEEDRNRVRFVAEHPLVGDTLFVEAGWTFYAQAFQATVADESTGNAFVDGRFRRHVGHVALTVRLFREKDDGS